MSIRLKTLAVLVSVFLIYAILNIAIFKWLVMPQLAKLERDEALKDMQRVSSTLQSELDHLDLLTHDWASWDDTYVFMEDRNQDYIDAGLVDSTYYDAGLNLICFTDSKGAIVWARAVDLESGEDVDLLGISRMQLDPDDPLLAGGEGMNSMNGYIDTHLGPMLVSSYPVLRSDNTGPSRGRLIFGRMISGEMTAQLTKRLEMAITVDTLENALNDQECQQMVVAMVEDDLPYFIHYQNRRSMCVHTLENDINGQPYLFLKVTIPRGINQEGQALSNFVIASLLTAGLVFLAITIVNLDRMVLHRIGALNESVRRIGESKSPAERLEIDGFGDELSNLAREINGMLDSLDEKEQLIIEGKTRDAELKTIKRATATFAHEINNPLTGIFGMAQLIKDHPSVSSELAEMSDELLVAAKRIGSVLEQMEKIKQPRFRNVMPTVTMVDLTED